MNIINQSIRLIIPFMRIFFVLTAGSVILYFILSFIFSGPEFIYLLLLIPVALVVLFGMVALILAEILKFPQVSGSYETNGLYSRKEMISLLVKSFLVVTCGVSLALLYTSSLEKEAITPVAYLFYSLDTLITLYAIGNIIKGEKLRELNIRHIQSENALLKSQLNPHFLYNTLNNIDALICFDADKASDAILKLSSLLRFMTYQGNNHTVDLRDEIRHIREYVELQQLRLENPETVCFQVEMTGDNIRIAPMLLMPFIENIFKHAADKINKEAIFISIDADERHLHFVSKNRAGNDVKQVSKESGVGLRSVKRRLKLLYPNRHSLEIIKKDNLFEVSLNIEFR